MTTQGLITWEYSQLTHGVTIATDHKLTYTGPEWGGDELLPHDDVVPALCAIGAVGWELIAVDTKHHHPDLEGNRWTNTVYTFKREARSDAPEPVFSA